LNRDLTGRFGDAAYALEEMIAEWTSGFLCADLGITAQPREDHAHYIANWLTALRNDKTAVFTAAAKANQAVEYLFGLQPDTASSASRQHYIDTGRYLTHAEAEVAP
jgi:antirestriction protein ArdC